MVLAKNRCQARLFWVKVVVFNNEMNISLLRTWRRKRYKVLDERTGSKANTETCP